MKKLGGILTMFFWACSLWGQVPDQINYQGRLVNDFGLVNAQTQMVFRLLDAGTGGNELLAETQWVRVVDGLYSVGLGASNVGPTAISDVLTNAMVFLEVIVGPVTLSPRERILSVAFAMHAGMSATSMDAVSARAAANAASNALASADAGLNASMNVASSALQSADAALEAALNAASNAIGGGAAIQSGTVSIEELGLTRFSADFSPAFGGTPVVTMTATDPNAFPYIDGVTANAFTGLASVAQYSLTTVTAAQPRAPAGGNLSLEIVNGNPAIAFQASIAKLGYVRANDNHGAFWGDSVEVDSGEFTGWFSSLKVVNGNPAIAYHNSVDDDLIFKRATDADGATWGMPVSVDEGGDTGYHPSMAIVNGFPAIAYTERTTQTVRYVQASSANGTAWNTPVLVDSNGTLFTHTQLQVVNGNPAMVYYEYSSGDIRYVRALDVNGAGWGTPVGVATNGTLFEQASLAIVNGKPAIAYVSLSDFNLYYVQASNANGTAWGSPVTVNAGGMSADHLSYSDQPTSLTVINGKPAIITAATSGGDRIYHIAQDADGTVWGPSVQPTTQPALLGARATQLISLYGKPFVAWSRGNLSSEFKILVNRAYDVDGTNWPHRIRLQGDYGRHLSVEVVDGNPAVAFYNNEGSLLYSRAGNTNGTVYGTPISPGLTANDVGQYSSLKRIGGKPGISYYDDTATNLLFVLASNAQGTAWGTPVVVATNGGMDTSLLEVQSKPAICFTDSQLKYVLASNAQGTAWSEPVIVDSETNPVEFVQMEIVDGNPAVVYFDSQLEVLKFTRAIDPAGTVWPIPMILDSAGDVGVECSMAIINGKPAVSYLDRVRSKVKYIRASDTQGLSWNTPVDVASAGGTNFVSLAEIDGAPAICFGDIQYTRGIDADGTAFGPAFTLLNKATEGHGVMKFVGGDAVIWFYCRSEDSLNVLRLTPSGVVINWMAIGP